MDRDVGKTVPESPEEVWADSHVGRYTLRRIVGTGGMGVVFAAHDPELDREVAIKLVTATFDDEGPVREAQAMAWCVSTRCYASAHENAIGHSDPREFVRTIATVKLAECKVAAGDKVGARTRLEAELALLVSTKADEIVQARLRTALAKTH